MYFYFCDIIISQRKKFSYNYLNTLRICQEAAGERVVQDGNQPLTSTDSLLAVSCFRVHEEIAMSSGQLAEVRNTYR